MTEKIIDQGVGEAMLKAIYMLRFECDERKNRSNRTKHGVWFEEAQVVFRDPNARLFHDPEHLGQ
jgi:hypothetical protein